MGKIILALLLLLALIFAMPGSLASALEAEGTYYVYAEQGEKNLGGFYETPCGLDAAKLFEGKIFGMAYKTGAENLGKLQKKLRVETVWETTVEGMAVIYGYSPLVEGGVRIGGRLINIQIAVRGNDVFLGSPLLLGGY